MNQIHRHHHLLHQVIAAMLQHRPFDPSLRPSPRFRGWSSDVVASILASIPRFFFLSPRSIGRQSTSRHRSPLRHRLQSHDLRGPAAHRNPATVNLGLSKALEFYTWVESNCGFLHDERTCREMSRLIAKSNSINTLWPFLRRNQPLLTTPTITSIINILGNEGLVKDALSAFYRMKQLHCNPDTISYNTIIAALSRVGHLKKARFLLDQMELPGARCPPDTFTYTILITAYCKRSLQTGCRKAIRRRMWEANHMFRRMLFKGFAPDVVTYNCLIDGLCKTYRIGRAHELFDEMLLKGCLPNRVTYNSFIRYYSVLNEVDRAVEMMRGMVERGHGVATSSSYTPIIHGLCETGRVKEAKDFLVEMVSGGSVPREYTYKLVRDALSSSGEEDLQHEICRKIEDAIGTRYRQTMLVKPMLKDRDRLDPVPAGCG